MSNLVPQDESALGREKGIFVERMRQLAINWRKRFLIVAAIIGVSCLIIFILLFTGLVQWNILLGISINALATPSTLVPIEIPATAPPTSEISPEVTPTLVMLADICAATMRVDDVTVSSAPVNDRLVSTVDRLFRGQQIGIYALDESGNWAQIYMQVVPNRQPNFYWVRLDTFTTDQNDPDCQRIIGL